MVIRISEVDPADETTLRAFWETEQASVRADREHAIPRSWERLVTMVSHPNDWYRRTLLVARRRRRGGRHGRASAGRRRTTCTWPTSRSTYAPSGDVEGIGRALHDEATQRLADDGRTSVCGEVYVLPAAAARASAAYAFAAALGFEPVHTEDHLLLRLPVGAGGRRPSAGARPTRRRTSSHLERTAAPTSTSSRSARCTPG